MKKTPVGRFLRRFREFVRRYHRPGGPTTQLSVEATRSIEVSPDNPEDARPKGDLYQIWREIPGGHKWWHYFETYERVFGALRSKPIRFLEIGVYQGGSLAMWRKYLHPDSIIVGLDIDPKCAQFQNISSNVHVRIGDQSDVTFLTDVFREFGPFDVILDDGSHLCSHMIKTFDFAFLNGLTDQGIYFAEDTHCCFWARYRDQSYSFVDLCKDLVDFMHFHYLDHQSLESFDTRTMQRGRSVSMPRIGAEIEEISFLDSLVIIRRNKRRHLPTVEHL